MDESEPVIQEEQEEDAGGSDEQSQISRKDFILCGRGVACMILYL